MSTKSKSSIEFIVYGLIFGPVIACAVLCPLSIGWYYNLDGPTEDVGQSNATPLLKALDAYQAKNHVYPAHLHELVPEYLTTIPRPAWRYDYLFMTNDDRSRFSLNFEEKGQAQGDGFCGYRSATAVWQCTDSSLTYP